MLNNLVEKHLLKALIIVFVLLFAFVSLVGNESEIESQGPNPFFKDLPQKYANKLEKGMENDSTYFSFTIEDFGVRELVVAKFFPKKSHGKMDFVLELYPVDKALLRNNKKFLDQELSNNASIYNFNGKTYGIWRTAVPYINIDKIVLEENPIYKRPKKWQETIKNPFKSVLTNNNNEKLVPIDKNLKQLEPNPYSEVFEAVLKNYNIGFQDHSYSVVNGTLFQVNKNRDAYLTGADITLATIKKPKEFWNYINSKDQSILDLIYVKGTAEEEVNSLLGKYATNNLELNALFDIKKLALFFALENLFSITCDQDFYLIFNENTNLLEPFYINSKCLGTRSNYVKKPKLEDIGFVSTYIKTLQEVSELDVIEDIIKLDLDAEAYLTFYNHYYPQNIFNPDLLSINQKIIKKSINQFSIIKPELLKITQKEMVITVLNMSNYPVVIKELSHNMSNIITVLDRPTQILAGESDTIKIALPRSFENLFVSKKKKVAEFKLYKHINELYIGYSLLGFQKISFSSITPYQKKELVKDDLFRELHAIDAYDFILVNKEEKSIAFSKDKITIDFPLIIPRGYVFRPKPGTQIDIVNGGKIISYAPLKFLGTKEKGIEVFSSDKKGQGILVLADGAESELNFTKFLDLTNPQHGNWSVTGAVTFYESPVKMSNVVIEGNRCEDALNIVRTTFQMRYCEISKTQSDAFDGDFVKGTIISSHFSELGNDAIDVSGSDLIIKDVRITNAGDKGLSAGEDSKMTIENVQIANSEIAVASKDFSIVTINNLKIENTKLGFTAFQKKPEFGPATISVYQLEITNVETKHLIESASSLTINGEKIETSANVKDRMYGVEFGRSSAETRNSQ